MEIERAYVSSDELLEMFSQHDDFMIAFLGEDSHFYTRYGEHEGIEAAWIARVDGQAAGCAAYRRKETSVGEVKRVFVRPEYRGREIAGALMEAVEQYAQEQGCRRLFLDTRITLEPAVTLYRKRGFDEIFRAGLYIQMEKVL